mgnify:CR=1 FL=1
MLPVRQKFGEFFRGQRSAEVVPLSLGAELGLQEGQLLLCFDTLGDYPLSLMRDTGISAVDLGFTLRRKQTVSK